MAHITMTCSQCKQTISQLATPKTSGLETDLVYSTDDGHVVSVNHDDSLLVVTHCPIATGMD
jgi:hypothetical protein